MDDFDKTSYKSILDDFNKTSYESILDDFDKTSYESILDDFNKTSYESTHSFKTHLFLSFQEIEKFRNLASEIMGLPSIEHFDMIRLDCEDLKRGLAQACRNLANELLSRVSSDHRRENERWEGGRERGEGGRRETEPGQ